MDPFDLARFRDAQAGVFETAREELRAGRKRSHWMWFMFPQMRGLGSSAMAQTYGLSSRAEAAAYLADPTLGPRLIEMFEIVLAHKGADGARDFRDAGRPEIPLLRNVVRRRARRAAAVRRGARPAFSPASRTRAHLRC